MKPRLPAAESTGADSERRRIQAAKQLFRNQRAIPVKAERKTDALALDDVLEEELDALHPEHAAVSADASSGSRRNSIFAAVHALVRPRTALCLSGGGIRSATFCLGALQALARCNLLTRFDYLSTVSGGGYIGSWLSGWLTQSGNPAAVQDALAGKTASVQQPEPEEVRHLREYSNYLTPRIGLLSADTWTLAGIVLRNLLLNWLLLIPVLLTALFIPVLFLWALAAPLATPNAVRWLFWLSALAGVVGLSYVGLDLPSLGNRRWSQGRFLVRCLTPLALATLGVTIAWAWRDPGRPALSPTPFVIGGAAFHLLATFASHMRLVVGAPARATPAIGPSTTSRKWTKFLGVSPWFYVVNPVTGAAGGWALWWLCTRVLPLDERLRDLPLYVVAAPGLVLLLVALLTTLFIGLTSWTTSEGDREWLARGGAWVLILVTGWAFISAISLYGSWLVAAALGQFSPGKVLGTLSGVSGAAGLLTAFLGFGKQTPASKEEAEDKPGLGAKLSNLVLKLAAPVFVIGVLLTLSYLNSVIARPILDRGWPPNTLYDNIDRFWIGVWVAIGLAALAWLLSLFIHVNKFSLHSMYRNRLVRAYLGASIPAKRREPSFFTGFSERDDVKMSGLSTNKPLHVINIALNLVHGRQLAWQERKAESFTVSRLHAGSSNLGCYRPTDRYGDGITIGTAAAISGAAASPNMGYHSSAAITFLMSLFNVRLGWWLGNPADAGWSTWDLAGPRIALRPLFAEALGRTDDLNPYVYLSDGGHFDNLGLYEMVLRRCHLIVVCDSGQDTERRFSDLGSAIRKCRVDLGIPIDLTPGLAGYGSIGKIQYSCVDGPQAPDGVIIYLKPNLNGSEPMDIKNYKALHAEFPHEPTSDQWFDESQFESYRALGSHMMAYACPEIGKHLG